MFSMLILSPEMIELYHILKEQRALNNKEKTQYRATVQEIVRKQYMMDCWILGRDSQVWEITGGRARDVE